MATAWSLGSLSFNDGPDGAGVEWWADVPTGWHSPKSSGRVVNRAGVAGGLIFGARKGPRALQITATVIAPSQATAENARNALEALVDGMIGTAVNLDVEETAGTKRLAVRYIDGLNVTVRTAAMFTFQLPVVALSPTKTSVP